MREVRFGDLKSLTEYAPIRELRNVILPIITVEKDGIVKPVGTCFVVSCTGKEALAFTAKHNIDYIMSIDGAKPLHNPSTPEEFRVAVFSSEPINLKMYVAYFVNDYDVVPCYIVKAWFFNSGPDIAAILLRICDSCSDIVFSHRFNIDSKGPKVGEKVQIYGYVNMETSDHETDDSDIIAKQTLSLPLKYVSGEVQDCYLFGEHHLVKWPCFKVNKFLDSGMSGGPAICTRNNESFVCGIVSSSPSGVEEGVCSKIYPATIIRIDAGFPFLSSNKPNLLECIEHKLIIDISEGYKHVLSNGEWSDKELANLNFAFDDEKFLGGRFMVESDELNKKRDFVWLSYDCMDLGYFNKHNSDDSRYYLISRVFHETLEEAERQGDNLQVQYLKEESPYIWFRVSNRTFRFFVFELHLSEGYDSIKILSDALIEEV